MRRPRTDADAAAVAARIRNSTRIRPTLAVVLGSAFGGVAKAIEVRRSISYRELPGFPLGGVRGHAGHLLLGTWHRTEVAVLCGRAHFYEGFELAEITFPVRVLAALGIDTLLLTNAAGGINRRFRPGDFMSVTDHINFMGTNPLRPGRAGSTLLPPRRRRPRTMAEAGPTHFLDLSVVYDETLRSHFQSSAKAVGARVHEGVYLAVSGPTYETPAEIRAFARLGADAIGMSTVPEAIVARSCGLRVAALSCITNRAAGLGARGNELSHDEVLATGAAMNLTVTRLVGEFVRRVGRELATY
jgi:inosine/guanosine/xanthosine phosphorylase family protein